MFRNISTRFLLSFFVLPWLFLSTSVLGQTPTLMTQLPQSITVNAAVRSGNTIYVGGSFTNFSLPTSNPVELNTTTGAYQRALPDVNGDVNAIVSDGNGGWFIGGSFTTIGGTGGAFRTNLAHIFADGTVDSWSPTPNGIIFSLSVVDGILYVGGSFSTISGSSRGRIASYQISNLSLTTFNPNAGNTVFCIAAVGAKLYVGGSFTTFFGQTRNRFAAINLIDNTLDPLSHSFNDIVRTISSNSTNLYVGGNFTTVNGITRNRIASINLATGLLTNFNPNADNIVLAICIAGNNLYAGGYFTNIAGQFRARLAAIDATTGTIVSSFNPSPNNFVHSIVTNGTLVFVGGVFTSYSPNGTSGGLAVFSASTSAFVYGKDSPTSIYSIAVDGNRLVLAGASSKTFVYNRNGLMALDAASGHPTSWSPMSGTSTVRTMLTRNGKIYVGGDFGNVAGQTRRYFAEIDSATGLPSSWNLDLNGIVDEIVTDGTYLYLLGSFTALGSTSRSRFAQVLLSSNTPTSWNPNPTGSGLSLALSGTYLYVGGTFTAIAGSSRTRLARFALPSMTLDAWNPSADNTVNSIAVGNGQVYVGGLFNNIASTAKANYAAFLEPSGSIVTGFSPVTNAVPSKIVLSGNTLFAGGGFTTANSVARNRFASFDANTGALTGWNVNANNTVSNVFYSGSTLLLTGSFGSVLSVGRSQFAAFMDCAGASIAAPVVATPSAVCPGTTVTITPTPVAGVSFRYWNAATGGTMLATGASFSTPIFANSTYYVDAFNGACSSATRTAVTLTPLSAPAVPVVSSSFPAACAGSASATITPTAVSGVSFSYWNAPTGGTQLSSGASYTVSPTATTTYYVEATNGTCTSTSRKAVTVAVTPLPGAPSVTSAGNFTTVCAGSSQVAINATLSGATNPTFNIWTAASGGTFLATSSSGVTYFVNPPPTTTTTYYVESVVNACTSATRTPITYTVNPLPAPAVVPTPAPTCYGSSVTITPTPVSGVTFYFWTGPGTGYFAQGSSYTISSFTSNITYYVSTYDFPTGCQSTNYTPVTATVINLPSQPTVPSPPAVCPGAGTTVTIRPDPQPGVSFTYWSNYTGGTLLGSGDSLNVTPAFTTNYYVEGTFQGCVIPYRTQVTASVTFVNPPTIYNHSLCGVQSYNLRPFYGCPNAYYYDSLTGGNLLGSGCNFFVTPTQTTTYYVAGNQNGCFSARTPVTITVVPVPAPAIVPTPAPTCPGQSTYIDVVTVPGVTNELYYDSVGGSRVAYFTNYLPAMFYGLQSTTYWVSADGNAANCSGPRTPVFIPFSPPNAVVPPIPPTCQGDSVTITPNPVPGVTFKYYPYSNYNSSPLATGPSYKVAITSSSTYIYVEASDGTCTQQNLTQVEIQGVPSPEGIVYTNSNCLSSISTYNLQLYGGVPPYHGTFSISNANGVDTIAFGPINSSNASIPIPAGQMAVGANTLTLLTLADANACSNHPSLPTVNNFYVYPPYTVSLTRALPSCTQAGVVFHSSIVDSNLYYELLLNTPNGLYYYYVRSGDTIMLTSVLNPTGQTRIIIHSAEPYYSSGCTPLNLDTIDIQVGPTPPIVQDITQCVGGFSTITPTPESTVGFRLWDAPIGGTLLTLNHSSDFTVVPAITTTYYVEATAFTSNGTCTNSTRSPVTVNVVPSPADPIVSGGNVCAGQSFTITPTPVSGIDFNFYSLDSFSNYMLVGSGASLSVSNLTQTTTYYVEAVTSLGCGSVNPVTATVNVLSAPAAPVVPATLVSCVGNSPIIWPTAVSGVNFTYWDAPVGGNQLGAGVNLTVTPTTTTTYYVEATDGLCVSATRSPITIQMTPLSVGTITLLTSQICEGSGIQPSVQFVSSIGAGLFTVRLGLPVNPQTFFNVNSGDTLYLYDGYLNPSGLSVISIIELQDAVGCSNNAVQSPVNFMVNPSPAAPVVQSSLEVCFGGSATIIPTPVSGVSFNYWSAQTGGTLLGTGAFYTAASLTQSSNVYVEAVSSAGCTSAARTESAILVLVAPIASFSISNATPVQNTPVVYTFTGSARAGAGYAWSFAGGTPSTAVGVGPHTVVYANAGTTTSTLVITDGPCTAQSTQSITSSVACLSPAITSVDQKTSTSMRVNWTPAAVATFYQLSYRLRGATNPFTNITVPGGGTASSVVISPLTANTVYEIRLQANCPNGTQQPAPSALYTDSTNSAPSLCVTPTITLADQITANSLRLNWASGTNSSSFQVLYRVSGTNAAPVTINVPGGGTATTAILSPLAANTTYDFQLRAYCTGNLVGAPSSVFSASTNSGAPLCTSPSIASVDQITSNSMRVNWVPSANTDFYSIQYRVQGSNSAFTTQTVSGNGSVSNFTISPLLASTSYEIQLRAYCTGNVPATLSSAFTATTSNSGSLCTTPSISNVDQITSTSARINWITGSNIVQYQLLYRALGTVTFTTISVPGGNVGNGPLSLLTPSTTYEVQLQAYCTGNIAVPVSNTFSFTTAASGTVCTTPNINSIDQRTSNSVRINWSASAGVSYYQLFYRVTGSSLFTAVTVPGGASSLACYVSQLSPNTSYEFKLRAFCTGNINAGDSPTMTASTNLAAPACATPVLGSFTNVTGVTAQVNWNLIPGAIFYLIRYRVSGVGPYLATQTPNGSVNSRVLTGLALNTAYQVYVTAYCSNSLFSANSNISTFTTASSMPSAPDLGTLKSGETDLPTDLSSTVYPNPSLEGKFTLRVNGVAEKDLQISMTDLLGREILTEQAHSTDAEFNRDFDMNLSNGTYILRVVVEGKQLLTRVVVFR
jgi:trimeric autotransporter adhesin